MKQTCKRGLAVLVAVLLLCSALAPGALATGSDTSASAAPEYTITPGTSAVPDITATPEPSPAASATPSAAPESTLAPETSPGPDASPTLEASTVPSASPESETPAPAEITDMFTTAEAALGDTVELYVEVNQEAGVNYQWQRLYVPPLEAAAAEALYPYGEGESTGYYFPLEGMSEGEVLAQNPEAVWPGIEIYYDQLAKQPMAMDSDAAAAEIRIENGTHNYVLEPVEALAESDDTPTGEWADLPGETGSVYQHEVTAEDAYSSYRCVVTVEAPPLEASPEPAASTTPGESGTPATTESPANEVLAAGDKLPAEPPESIPAASQAPEAADEAFMLISDSMYLSLFGQAAPEPEAASRLFSTRAGDGTQAVQLPGYRADGRPIGRSPVAHRHNKRDGVHHQGHLRCPELRSSRLTHAVPMQRHRMVQPTEKANQFDRIRYAATGFARPK